MSVSTQSDSDYQLEAESDHSLPEGQDSGRGGNGVMKQDDNMLLPLSSPRQRIRTSSNTAGPDHLYRAVTEDMDLDGDKRSWHTRPNRWYGPDSTWLAWTEHERLAVQSLDRARAQDLSIHLYNAYTLKAGSHRSRQNRRARSKDKAPVRPGQRPYNGLGYFLPTPSGWTDWPLPPGQVPREPLLPQTSRRGVYRSQGDSRLSNALEECIIATTTRIARQRWNCRSVSPEVPGPSNLGIKVDDEVTDQEEDADLPQSSFDDQDSPAEPEPAETPATRLGSSASNSVDEPLFTSQAYDLVLNMDQDERNDDDKNSTNDEEIEVDQPAVPITDDDKARAILLAGTRHILSRVDDLLMGLHRARQAYATVTLRRKAEVADDESDSAQEQFAPRASSDRYRGRERGRERGRKRKRGRSISVATGVSTKSHTVDSGDGRERKDRWRTLQPRGWSDVVGMAALTGWHPAVVERASQRCAQLFGQNMLFRTFHEGDRTRNQDSRFTEYEALDGSGGGGGGGGGGGHNDDGQASGLDSSRWTIMIRASRPCDECLEQEETCKAQQDIAIPGKAICRRCREQGIPCSGIALTMYNRKRHRACPCPYPDCARHDLPFRSVYDLQRHIDNAHQDSSLPLHSDAAFVVPSVESQLLTQGPLLFSSQPDEIICPIVTCPRHNQPFSRGARLYQHMRNLHPDVDVQQVKKIESKRRGETRGRYRDESRRSQVGRANRSRSKSTAPPADSSGSGSDSDPNDDYAHDDGDDRGDGEHQD